MSGVSGDRLGRLFGFVTAIALLGVGVGAAAASHPPSPPLSLGWVYPYPTPAGWKHLSLPSGGAVLWYPPSLRPISGAPGSVSVAAKDGNGNELASLTITPKLYEPNMSQQGIARRIAWPGFRIGQLRAGSATSVHEDAHVLGGAFRGGVGACVMDDYVARVKSVPYREIACLVQGGHDSVIVAAVQVSAWAQFGALLERAVAAYQVT